MYYDMRLTLTSRLSKTRRCRQHIYISFCRTLGPKMKQLANAYIMNDINDNTQFHLNFIVLFIVVTKINTGLSIESNVTKDQKNGLSV